MLVLLAIRHERLSLTRLGSKNNRQGRPLEVAEGAHLTPNFQNLRATRCFVSGVEAPGKQGSRPTLCQSALAGTETPLLRLFHPFQGPCPSVTTSNARLGSTESSARYLAPLAQLHQVSSGP